MKKILSLIVALLAVHYAAFADYAQGPAAVSISVNGSNSVYYALPIQDWNYSYYITWDDPDPTAWSGYLAMDPLPSSLPSGFGSVTSLSVDKVTHVLWTNDNTVVDYLQYRVYPDTQVTDDSNPPYLIGATMDASTIILGSSTADQRREANPNIDLLSFTSGPGGYYVEFKLSYAEKGETSPTVYVPGSWVRIHFTVPSSNPPAQYPVTLKVIDQSKGEITNNVDDNNETNIFCWIDDNLAAQNPRTPGDWWYPMYNDSGVTPTGALIKGADDWTWEITLNATQGTYEWNPNAKTLEWAPINPDMYAYTGDDGNNLIFTVSETGEISGHTELVIPNPTGLPKIQSIQGISFILEANSIHISAANSILSSQLYSAGGQFIASGAAEISTIGLVKGVYVLSVKDVKGNVASSKVILK